MMGAAHALANDKQECDDDDIQDSTYQYTRILGSIYAKDEIMDMAISTCDNYNVDLDGEIEDLVVGRINVEGYYTDWGVANLAESNETVYATGTSTGTRGGKIERTKVRSNEDCSDWNSQGVKTNLGSAAGDSGGPIYTRDGYLVGMHTEGQDSTGNSDCDGDQEYYYALGPTMYEITDRWPNMAIG